MPSTVPNKSLNPAADNGGSRMEGAPECDSSYRARRYAVKYEPPCVFLEYEDATKRRRVRAVKLNGVQPNVDVDRLTRKIIRSFPRRLDPTSVKSDQVRRLVVSLLEYLNKGTNGADSGGTAVASGSALGRNGSTPPVPSRLGPGGGGGASRDGAASATAATAGSRTKAPLGRLSDFPNGSGGAHDGSTASPMPSASPRGIDPRIGPAARLAMGGLNGNYRGSVESTMSRFSTSTASASSSSSGEVEEEEEEYAGTEGRRSGSGLASALDELDRELGAPGSTSDLSMVANGGGSGSAGMSSDFDSRASSSSLSVRDKPLPGVSKLPPVGAAGTTTGVLPPPAGAATAGPGAGAAAAAASAAAAKSRFAAEAEKLVIGLEVTDDLDLNRVTEVELRMAKQAMEADFKKNQLKPGDPGYVYDKQEDFGPPTQDNDWDDSEDEEEEAPSEDPEVDWADIHASVSKNKGALTSVQVHAGVSSGSDSGGKNGQSPYNSSDWP